MLTAAVLLIAAAAPADSAPHPFSVQDMVSFQRISDPQVSPDGKLVVFGESAGGRRRRPRPGKHHLPLRPRALVAGRAPSSSFHPRRREQPGRLPVTAARQVAKRRRT